MKQSNYYLLFNYRITLHIYFIIIKAVTSGVIMTTITDRANQMKQFTLPIHSYTIIIEMILVCLIYCSMFAKIEDAISQYKYF